MEANSGTVLFFIILGIFIIEGVLLLTIYKEKKKLEIEKINEDAHIQVEQMSDDTLVSKLTDELNKG
jgi:hypothetical protein